MYIFMHINNKYLSVIKIHNEEGSLIENGSKLLGELFYRSRTPRCGFGKHENTCKKAGEQRQKRNQKKNLS